MSEEIEESVAPAVCRLLRTKTAFGTYVGNLYSWQSGASTTAVYWCLGTMETAGPDDHYAHPHTCCEGRDCYEGTLE
ncbi:MAG TPA: hypothetical protein VJS44_16100 [Pyrinomonadaceae bacterium]|nr:hypothetical protein [Pyrinomonadaceae bacterium]